MKLALLSSLLVIHCCFLAIHGQENDKKIGSVVASTTIKGWSVPTEADLRNYEIFLDKSVRMSGSQSLSIRSRISDISAPRHTIVRQNVRANPFEHKRIRFSAFVKSDSADGANLFLNIDGPWMIVTNRDHMESRRIAGTSDWREYSIVLDVPANSEQLVFGIRLAGGGQMWVDNLKFEIVGSEVPLTGIKDPTSIQTGSASFVDEYRRSQPLRYEKQVEAYAIATASLPDTPQNLDFEN